MPKQGWDVADNKTNRRMLGTTQEFTRSGYDHYHIGAPGFHDDVGVNHTVRGVSAAPVGFPKVQDKFSYGFLHPSEHWATGIITIKTFWSSPRTLSTGEVAEVTFRIDGCYAGGLPGAAADVLYADTSKVFTPDAVANTLVQIDWETAAISVSDYEFFTWRIGRLGSSGTDNINGPVDFYMMEIEWHPVVATA